MKKRSIFENLATGSTSVPGGETHEFFAEQLESRVLYSAAPVPVAEATVAVEATETQGDASFESIESFKDAAEDHGPAREQGSIDKVLTLASFDDMAIDEPVTFDSSPVVFKRWEADLKVSDNSEVKIKDLPEPKIVDIAAHINREDCYEFSVQRGKNIQFDGGENFASSRIIALTDETTVFRADSTAPVNIFGMSQIEASIEGLVEFVA